MKQLIRIKKGTAPAPRRRKEIAGCEEAKDFTKGHVDGRTVRQLLRHLPAQDCAHLHLPAMWLRRPRVPAVR
jgi:hypothetical protein